jgi:putative NADH-flavin reductase
VFVANAVRQREEKHEPVVDNHAQSPPAGTRADGLYSAGARALVAAMLECGFDRLVALSSSGVRQDDPNHPLWYRVVARPLLAELYADMRRMEDIVRETSIDWTFVRPARIVDEPPTGVYRAVDGSNPEGGASVSRVDLARFVVRAVDDERWSRRRPTVAR